MLQRHQAEAQAFSRDLVGGVGEIAPLLYRAANHLAVFIDASEIDMRRSKVRFVGDRRLQGLNGTCSIAGLVEHDGIVEGCDMNHGVLVVEGDPRLVQVERWR